MPALASVRLSSIPRTKKKRKRKTSPKGAVRTDYASHKPPSTFDTANEPSEKLKKHKNLKIISYIFKQKGMGENIQKNQRATLKNRNTNSPQENALELENRLSSEGRTKT